MNGLSTKADDGMAKVKMATCAGLLFALFGLGLAQPSDHVVVGFAFDGHNINDTRAFYNDVVWFHRLLLENGASDVVCRVWSGWPPEGQPINGENNPVYRVSCINGPATVAGFDSTTQEQLAVLGPEDLFVVFITGDGGYEDGHSVVEAEDAVIIDTTVARCLNRGVCRQVVIIGSCWAWTGFSRELIDNAPDSIRRKRILLTATGPNGNFGCEVDNIGYPGGPTIPGLEAEVVGGVTYRHGQFPFDFIAAMNGGVMPSDSVMPLDSIDRNHDGRVSVQDAFAWSLTYNSQNYPWDIEDNQMVDSGVLAQTTIIWPYLGIIDSVDAQPLSIVVPDTADSGSVFRPVVRVKNNGIDPESVFARLWIGDGYNRTRTKRILPNHEDTLTFAPCTALVCGWATVRCSTELAGDQTPGNDVLVDSTLVVPAHVAVGEPGHAGGVAQARPAATVVRQDEVRPERGVAYFDAAGRPVWPEALSPGVYFRRVAGAHVTRLVIVR